MGQADLGVAKPSKFYLPMAGSPCRVVLKFKGKKVVAIEPGQAFDAAQWREISNEIEHSILAGPTRIGREYSFSGRRVIGSWRGEHSGVQILPAPADAPSAPVESADHPIILEFPLLVASRNAVTNYRRLRKHRDLTLLLNILLVGGAKSMGFRPTHFWAVDPADLSHNSKWAQQGFFAPLGPWLIHELSTPAAEQLEELAPEEYEAVLGHDGGDCASPPISINRFAHMNHFRLRIERSSTAQHFGSEPRRACGMYPYPHHSRPLLPQLNPLHHGAIVMILDSAPFAASPGNMKFQALRGSSRIS